MKKISRFLFYVFTLFFVFTGGYTIVQIFSKSNSRPVIFENKNYPPKQSNVASIDFENRQVENNLDIQSKGIPVLCYHQIVTKEQYMKKPTSYAVTVDQFEKQLRWMYESGYKTITPNQLNDYVTKKSNIFEKIKKPFVLTFDDGLNDFTKYAEAVLNKFHFKGVLYIYPTYIMAKKKRALTWAQIKAIAKRGHIIGSHTFWHPLLNKMTVKEQRLQFKHSKKIIKKYTGIVVDSLAYPFGLFTNDSFHLLKELGYKTALTIFGANNKIGQNSYYLNRYMVVQSHSLKTFQHLVEQNGLPIAHVEPMNGSFIEKNDIVQVQLPKHLDLNQFVIKKGSHQLNFNYSPHSGKLEIQLGSEIKRFFQLTIRYQNQNLKKNKKQNYKATLLFNYKKKENEL